ncbi:transformer-2 protein homolog beta-like [Rhopalosiphum maidis]|uniref:transformer-2 protein homolog beta-like n=1 Tax=Rhopalosiphum maidis TaxID=43146 RepID=UPI000EFF6BBF|nr:transformer-2 protein homolog beta-like [Rhopalosiphum maidis]
MDVQEKRNKGSRSRSRSRSFSKRNRSSSQRDRKSCSRSPLNDFKSRSKSSYRSRSRSSCNYMSRSTYSRSRSSSYSSNGRRSFRSRSRIRSLDKSNRCLGIFGLDCNTNEHQLHRVLSKYGTINSINIVMDAKSGKSRGFGFAYFKYIDDARKAKEKCSGMVIDGQKIRIDFSFSRRNDSLTHGVYVGRNIMKRGSVDRHYRGERYDNRYNQDNNDGYVHERYRNEKRRHECRESRSSSFRYKYLHVRSKSRSSSPCRYA